MRKLNLKKIITMGLIATSILAVVPVGASAEWRQSNNGWWYAEGNSYSKGWRNIGGSSYYFDNNGYMKTGWINNGSWYYFSPSGAMQKGWIQDGGSWYYLKADGTMATGNVVADGKASNFDGNGKWLGYINNNQNTNNTQQSNSNNNSNNTVANTTNSSFTRDDASQMFLASNQTTNDGIKFGISLGNGDSPNIPSIEDTILTDAKGRYRIFAMTRQLSNDYLGILKVYSDGTFEQCKPGEYYGISAEAEKLKLFHKVVIDTGKTQEQKEMDRMSNLQYREGHMDEYNRLVAKYNNK